VAICGMDGILNNLGPQRSGADQVCERSNTQIADRPSRVSREVRTAFTEPVKVVNVESSIGLTVDR
jgi:hypothetical protein